MSYRNFIYFVVIPVLLLHTSSTFSIKSEGISKGDNYFTKMRYLDAIAWYNTDSSSAEAQWRIARANICYGDVTSKALKESYFRKAEHAARRSIALDEQNGNGHTWLAAALGNIAMYEGSKTKVLLVTEITRELHRAIALNPNDDAAYSILGSVYREVGNISWFEKQLAQTFIGKLPEGGYPESEVAFRKAISIAPNIMRHWFELGLLYQYQDKTDLARQAFTKAKSCPVFLKSDEEKLIKIEVYLKTLK